MSELRPFKCYGEMKALVTPGIKFLVAKIRYCARIKKRIQSLESSFYYKKKKKKCQCLLMKPRTLKKKKSLKS